MTNEIRKELKSYFSKLCKSDIPHQHLKEFIDKWHEAIENTLDIAPRTMRRYRRIQKEKLAKRIETLDARDKELKKIEVYKWAITFLLASNIAAILVLMGF